MTLIKHTLKIYVSLSAPSQTSSGNLLHKKQDTVVMILFDDLLTGLKGTSCYKRLPTERGADPFTGKAHFSRAICTQLFFKSSLLCKTSPASQHFSVSKCCLHLVFIAGLFIGTFGAHGPEIIQLQRTTGEVTSAFSMHLSHCQLTLYFTTLPVHWNAHIGASFTFHGWQLQLLQQESGLPSLTMTCLAGHANLCGRHQAHGGRQCPSRACSL